MDSTRTRRPASVPPVSWQFGVAVAILLGFVGLVAFMLATASHGGSTWDRRVFIFGAAEALVFTAVGWIFGREVSRSSLDAARDDARAAKGEAEEARAKIAICREEATLGRALAAAIASTVEMPVAPSGGRPHDLGVANEAAASSALYFLKCLGKRLFPENR